MIVRDQSARYASQLHGEVPVDSDEAAWGGVDEELAHELEVGESEPGGLEEPAERKRGKWGKRVGWFLAMSAMGVVVGVVIAAGMKFIDGPVSASANSTTLAQAVATPSTSPHEGELSGLYVDVKYPGVFDQVKQVKNNAHSYEQYVVSSSSDYSRTIAVDVEPLPSGLLNDDSSYRVREIAPSDYTLRSDKIGGEPVGIFSKTDKTEQTLFWAHKGNEVTVAITTTNPQDNLADFMKTVETGLRWRQ